MKTDTEVGLSSSENIGTYIPMQTLLAASVSWFEIVTSLMTDVTMRDTG